MFFPALRRWLPLFLAIGVSFYGGLLRLDALVSRYGVVDHPRWARAVEGLAPIARPLKPAMYAWWPVANPYVGGDPYSYLQFARDMRSFYQAHVREPVFLALTRVWLWLLDNQNVAVSFASLTGSVAAIFGTYLLAAAAYSPLVGVLAAGALAIDYDAVSWAPDGWRDDTFTAAFVFAMWALVRLRRRPTSGNAVLAGSLGALACLTRLTALSFFVPSLILIAFSAREEPRRMRRATLLAAATAVLLVSPYLINCARTFGDPLVAVNVHTGYYRSSEGLASERPESAARYLIGKFERRPLYEIDTAIEGLFVRPMTNKWSGFDLWLHGTARTLEALAIVGLALFATTPDGRLLLLMGFMSLVPFAFTWNVGGGGEWRFTMQIYPVYLIAAALAIVTVVRGLRPSTIRSALEDRRGLALASAVLLVMIGVLITRRTLPYYVAREALAGGQPVDLVAGPRDGQFFTAGWSPWHPEGNVTVRVTTAERSIVKIPLPSSAEYVLTLRADPVQPSEPQALTLLLNRRLLRNFALEWNPNRVGTYRVTLPPDYTRPGSNELQIVPARTIKAADAGERFRWIDPHASIGSRVWYVRIDPIRASGPH